ncbi:DUF4190 domain-containing protein [Streptomyces sp. NPDC014724]|uniref:DUF4190 domain-containing protein n=1 Tax=unclassified Streptomyces TaxID=2593676 RepID=UPI0036FEAFD6
MTLTASVRRPAGKPAGGTGTGTDTGVGVAPGTEIGDGIPPGGRTGRARDADGLAVASFVLGLVGLLVMNILLGPAAIVMAVIALARSTSRRGRAFLGLALGIADLVVLALLVISNGTVSWNFAG